MPLATVEEALADIKAGKFVIVVDDEKRENEGDLILAAEKVTPEAVNFMAQYARGLVCVPIVGERLDQLGLPLMVCPSDKGKYGTAFTTSIDYRKGTSTGISAHDRSATICALADPATKTEDFIQPGHMFPLRYREGGVLVRQGHTEAAVDLARMAGLQPAGVVCEIMNPDGSMARMPQLEEFSRLHELNLITISQLIAYRRHNEILIQRVAEARLPTKHGIFTMIAFRSTLEPGEHLALVMGKWEPDEPVLVRVHSECLTGDVFGSQRCDCGEQIHMALRRIGEEGRGVFVYMRQEGRGIGLHNKVLAYSLQDNGLDTVEANESLGFESDMRDYGLGAQILLELGVKNLRLLTNNPRKMIGLSGFGLQITGREPVDVEVTDENRSYIEAKRHRMGHLTTPA